MSARFVIHEHSGAGPLHYDLMLESGQALATWRLPACPLPIPAGQDVHALRIADHRVAYLTHEGPTRDGGSVVRRLDRGGLEVLEQTPARWRVRLSGAILAGEFELIREGDDDRWVFRPSAAAPD